MHTLLLFAALLSVALPPEAPTPEHLSISIHCDADYNEEPDAAVLLRYPDASVVGVNCVLPISSTEAINFFTDAVYPNLSDLPTIKGYYNGEMNQSASRHWIFVLLPG